MLRSTAGAGLVLRSTAGAGLVFRSPVGGFRASYIGLFAATTRLFLLITVSDRPIAG